MKDMQNIPKKLPLLITTGEPAGIGMDVVLLLAAEGKLQDFKRPTGSRQIARRCKRGQTSL